MIGKTLGRYRILAELGRGGMGVVYRATQTTLDRTVAIKMLSPHLADSGDHLQRFRREAEVLARLQHENIVHIYDVEEVEGSFCIVMEYVSGPSLADVLERSGTLDAARVRDIAMPLAAGLEAAHRQGVVHRDLKPDNILFTPEGRPKITDFGIARIAGDDAMSRTRTGILLGTPYYMSPEQARGGEITGASDQYALGVLLYQMLSGRVPFDGNDPISVAIKHMHETPTPLEALAPGVHPGLAEVVRRSMYREPTGRYASAGEMASVLKRLRLEDLTEGVGWIGASAAPLSRSPVVDGACPACGTRVQPAFRTCPKCATALTWNGEAQSVAGPGAAARAGVPGAASPEPVAPVGGGSSSSGTSSGSSPGSSPGFSPGGAAPWFGSSGGKGRLPALGNRLRGMVPLPRLPDATGARVGGIVERWTRPGGRWNLPPILWVGVVLLGIGLSIGVVRALAPAFGQGSRDPGALAVDPALSTPDGGGAALPPSGGSRVAGGGDLGFLPRTGEGSGSGASAGSSGSRSDAAAGAGGSRENPNPDPDPDPGPPVVVTEPDRPEVVERPVLPSRDLARERADLAALVERQRRATETGDAALFRRDLSADLGRLHAPFLTELHQTWSGISSEVTDLSIDLPPLGASGPDLARVDFHTRISATPRAGGPRRLIQDTHVYWVLQRTERGWLVVEVTSAPHDEEQSQ